MSGNLCRCQDYDKILTALERGAAISRRWPVADNKLVGQNYTTPDLLAKVTGKSSYAEDFRAEGMLFAKLLLSPSRTRGSERRHQRCRGHARRARHPPRQRAASPWPTR